LIWHISIGNETQLHSTQDNKTATMANTGRDEMLTRPESGMSQVIYSIDRLRELRHKGEELDETLESLEYFSVLKHFGPILLGIGLGVRLARSHFDVKAELAKEARDRKVDLSDG